MHFRALTYARLKTAEEMILFIFLTSIISLAPVPFTHAAPGTISLDFKKEGLSARIEKASMKDVIEKIAEREGIWIKGAEKLSEEVYSGIFEGLSIRDALKRILLSFNYCFFLDGEEKVLGVIVVGKRGRRAHRRIRRR